MPKWKKRLKDFCPTSATTVDVSRTTLIALKESSDAFPPLKSVCGGVLAIWDTVERLKSCKSEARALANRCKDVLERLADAVQPDPANIPPTVMRDISRFQLLLDDILASTEKMARQPTGTFRVLKGLKGLKRLNRDESELGQFHRCLDEAGQAFVVSTTARVEVSVTRIEGLTTRIGSSMTRTELSTAQIQLSTSKLELSNSCIERNFQALEKDLKQKTDFFVVSLAYGSTRSLGCMTYSHSLELRIHMGCSGPRAKTSISAYTEKENNTKTEKNNKPKNNINPTIHSSFGDSSPGHRTAQPPSLPSTRTPPGISRPLPASYFPTPDTLEHSSRPPPFPFKGVR
ncbi:hypothetical protein C8J56DRAFT_406128 [Mycena floridula]|nr:hypothetical protein C8J56DRAFT_406128 [Mycena floridula]